MTFWERLRQWRGTALYVQFRLEADIDAVCRALESTGARVWEVDEDVDLQHWPQGGVFRPAAVFRLRPQGASREALLSAAAHLPCVWSVCDTRTY